MNKCIRAIETNYENYEYDDEVKMISSIAEHLIDDSKIWKLLEKLFIEINEYNISFSDVVNNRKKIDDSHQKILKKLNPFEE